MSEPRTWLLTIETDQRRKGTPRLVRGVSCMLGDMTMLKTLGELLRWTPYVAAVVIWIGLLVWMISSLLG